MTTRRHLVAGGSDVVAGLLTVRLNANADASVRSQSRIIRRERAGRTAERVSASIALLALLALFLVAPGCSKATGQSAAELTSASGPASDGVARIQILPPDKTTGELPVQRIDLGTAYQGETLRRTIKVENHTPQVVSIDRFEGSCECMKVRGTPFNAATDTEQRLQIEFNGAKEPEFQGVLAIQMTGLAESRPVLRFELLTTVVPAPVAKSPRAGVSQSPSISLPLQKSGQTNPKMDCL